MFCPSCGKEPKQTRYRAAQATNVLAGKKLAENFAFECGCTTMILFARRWDGKLRSVYFIEPQNFDAVWESNSI